MWGKITIFKLLVHISFAVFVVVFVFVFVFVFVSFWRDIGNISNFSPKIVLCNTVHNICSCWKLDVQVH